MPRGRPTKYRPEYVEQVRKLATFGANQLEIADFLRVRIETLWRWTTRYPELRDAIKIGKEAVDERVQSSLYHKALGYSRDTEKIFMHEGEPVRVPVREHIPPDTASMIFWLKNRRPAEWRDRVELNGQMRHGGTIGHVHSTDAQAMEALLDQLSVEELLVLEGIYEKLENGELGAGGQKGLPAPQLSEAEWASYEQAKKAGR